MRARQKQARRGMTDIMRNTMRIVGRELVLATPVKTGLMRSNWQAGQFVITNVREPYSPNIGYGSDEVAETTGPNYRDAIDQHRTAAMQYKNPVFPLYITNAVPYLHEVNFGTAKQTPTGFFERAIDRAVKRKLRRGKIFGPKVTVRRV